MSIDEEIVIANQISGWIGAALVAAVVWLWDDKRVLAKHPRQSISGAHWEKPLVTVGIWTYLWIHLVLKIPKRILVRW